MKTRFTILTPKINGKSQILAEKISKADNPIMEYVVGTTTINKPFEALKKMFESSGYIFIKEKL